MTLTLISSQVDADADDDVTAEFDAAADDDDSFAPAAESYRDIDDLADFDSVDVSSGIGGSKPSSSRSFPLPGMMMPREMPPHIDMIAHFRSALGDIRVADTVTFCITFRFSITFTFADSRTFHHGSEAVYA